MIEQLNRWSPGTNYTMTDDLTKISFFYETMCSAGGKPNNPVKGCQGAFAEAYVSQVLFLES